MDLKEKFTQNSVIIYSRSFRSTHVRPSFIFGTQDIFGDLSDPA